MSSEKGRLLQARVTSPPTVPVFPLVIDGSLPFSENTPLSIYPGLNLTTDGAGLFAGVVKHLLARGTECPKVIATTHFHELFSTGALEPQELPITFIHMEIMFATHTGEVIDDSSSTITKSDSITFLYRSAS